jgi:hypothetical protein
LIAAFADLTANFLVVQDNAEFFKGPLLRGGMEVHRVDLVPSMSKIAELIMCNGTSRNAAGLPRLARHEVLQRFALCQRLVSAFLIPQRLIV